MKPILKWIFFTWKNFDFMLSLFQNLFGRFKCKKNLYGIDWRRVIKVVCIFGPFVFQLCIFHVFSCMLSSHTLLTPKSSALSNLCHKIQQFSSISSQNVHHFCLAALPLHPNIESVLCTSFHVPLLCCFFNFMSSLLSKNTNEYMQSTNIYTQ